MHLLKTQIHGNCNIGLYIYATKDYCLAGLDVPKNILKDLNKIFQVPVYQLNLCGTSLIGVFAAGNDNCLLLPSIVFDNELSILDKHKINYQILDSTSTALGNNIVANQNGCIVNSNFSVTDKKFIKNALKVDLKPGTIAGLDIVGSLAVLRGKYGVAHHDITPDERKKFEFLDVEIHTATVNLGNPYISSGLTANNNGFIIGAQSTGVEITNIDESLGFMTI